MKTWTRVAVQEDGVQSSGAVDVVGVAGGLVPLG